MNKEKHEFNMGIARQASTGSKDPSTKVGAFIVDSKNRPISLGYNGFIKGSDDNLMSYKKPEKYYKILHAEVNSIIFAKRDLDECILYCTHAPCNECLKLIMQSGIKTVIYEYTEPYERMDEDILLAIADISLSKEGFKAYSIYGVMLHKDIEMVFERRKL